MEIYSLILLLVPVVLFLEPLSAKVRNDCGLYTKLDYFGAKVYP